MTTPVLPGLDEPPVPEWPGQLERVARVELFVRHAPCAGPDPAPAVFLHGLGGASTNFTDLMHLLHDVVEGWALDLPGFGRSGPNEAGYSIATHTQVVIAFLESLGAGPVHVFGNSMGGAVAVRLAHQRPDLVRSLTLLAPALPDLRPRRVEPRLPVVAAPVIGERVWKALARQAPEKRAAALLNLCYADPGRVRPERRAAAVAEVARRRDVPHADDAFLGSVRSVIGSYLVRAGRVGWTELARSEIPLLVVYGQQDRLVSARNAARVSRLRPDAQVVVLDDCGHVPQMEHPEQVAVAVRKHLASL